MTRALLYKEFRETLPIAAIGLACLLLISLDAMSLSPFPGLLGYRDTSTIPFVPYNENFSSTFALTAGALAIALGFWHALGDFWGQAHLFLLHRPINRRTFYLTKLGVGLAVYLFTGAAAILFYATWAATPGTHASPFAWSMTLPTWTTWLATSTLYLGAFLAGVRPAAWLGTRLAPLAAAGLIAFFVGFLTSLAAPWPLLLIPLLLIGADVALMISILAVVDSRDFG